MPGKSKKKYHLKILISNNQVSVTKDMKEFNNNIYCRHTFCYCLSSQQHLIELKLFTLYMQLEGTISGPWYCQSLNVKLLYETQLMTLTCAWHGGNAKCWNCSFHFQQILLFMIALIFCHKFTDPTAVHRYHTLNPSENITQYSSWQHRFHYINQPKQGSKWGEQLGSYVLLIMHKKKM